MNDCLGNMCVVLCRVALGTMESLPFLETRYLISSRKEIATFGVPDTKRSLFLPPFHLCTEVLFNTSNQDSIHFCNLHTINN